MNFTIALFGSFKDTNGYAWKLPNGINQNSLQDVANHFLKYYEDGRRLLPNEIYGGYFLDSANQVFYAFRFIDGGQDSYGRAGVVITNWAIAPFSEVCAKSIRTLFDLLTFKMLPESGKIFVSDTFEFSLAATTLSEGNLTGDAVDTVFRLPGTADKDVLVQFELKNQNKNATIKCFSPLRKHVFPKTKIKTVVQEIPPPINKKKRGKRFSFHMVCASVLFVALILFGIGLWPNKSRMTEVDSPIEQLNSSLHSEDVSQTVKDTSSYASTTGNDSNEDDTPSVSSFFYKHPDVNSFAIFVIAKETCVWKDTTTNNVAHFQRGRSIECGKTEFNLVIDKSVVSLQFYDPTPIFQSGSSDNHDSLSFYINDIDDGKYILTVTDSSWEIRVDKRFKHTGESPLPSTYSNLTQESESYSLKDVNDIELAQLLIEANKISFNSYPSIPATFVLTEENNLSNFDQTISFANNVFFVFFNVDTQQSVESLDMDSNFPIDNGGSNE